MRSVNWLWPRLHAQYTTDLHRTHYHCGSSLCNHMSIRGPSHSFHFIDIQDFIDICCLDISPHTGRDPVYSKRVTGGCIELFWSISSDLLCLAVCVYVCIDDLKSRRRGWDTGGGRATVIRSGPLTSLCADKAGHTLKHTQTAIPKHQRLITHLRVIFLWFCLWLQHHTYSFFYFIFFTRAQQCEALTG